MTAVKLTRQRIKDNVSFATTVPPAERKRRLKWSAEEDTEREWGGGWHVTRVEVVKVVPDEDRDGKMEQVIAVITETKTVTV